MIILNKKYHIEVDNERYFRRLGYPTDYNPPEHVEELIDRTKGWYLANGNPWIEFYEIDVNYHSDVLIFDDINIHSQKLLKRFQKHQVKKAVLIATTAGDKVDNKVSELWADDISDQSFFLDAYSSAYTEMMVSKGVEIIREWAQKKGLKALSRYSPGYPGWALTEQHQLIEIINNKNKSDIPIQVLESSILTPKKSQFSIIGLTKNQKYKEIAAECVSCSLLDCKCIDAPSSFSTPAKF